MAQSEDARLSDFLQAAFLESARLSPETLTQLGMKDRYGELGDYERDQGLPVLRPVRVGRVESDGDLLVVPAGRHSLDALEDSAVLLTVAKLP